jgi:hypothetical protein
MKFEFAKYTEITDFAHKVNPEYQSSGYTRIFICPDVCTFWLCRLLPNTNEEYEEEEGVFVMERNNIEKEDKLETLTKKRLTQILEDDDFSNWDVFEAQSEEEAVELLDDGFGILNLKENT